MPAVAERDQKKTSEQKKAAERAAREQYEQAIVELREGSYRFASKVRGQAGIILEELIDPDGEAVATLADSEGDAGALALALPLDIITMETWLFGQIGDKDELDLDINSHKELWFNFGAWIGETMRRRHGGHWLFNTPDPKTWRLGFSKIMLEIAPHTFAEQLLRMGPGAVRNLVSELERLRELHARQKEKNGGQEFDRYTPQHYIRMHTVPLGQWMVIDLALLGRLWSVAATRDLVKEIKKNAKRLGAANAPVIEKLLEALGKADQTKPIAAQSGDRGLMEAVAQIVCLRRAAAPVAIDILESMVVPTMHIGIPDRFPPLDEDDVAALHRGAELFEVFIDVVPHKFHAEDEGFLGAIPNEVLSTPYPDRNQLEITKGDWVVVDTKAFKKMLLEFDSKRLLDKYDDFVKYVNSNPKAPRRRDSNRSLVETVAKALVDLKGCVVAASTNNQALVFRMLPPPP